MTTAMKTDAQDAFWEIMTFFGPRLFLHELRPRMREMIEAGMYAEAHFLATLCDEQRRRRAALERGEDPDAPDEPQARWDFTPEGPVYGPPGRQVPMQGHARFKSPMQTREEAEAEGSPKPARDWRMEG